MFGVQISSRSVWWYRGVRSWLPRCHTHLPTERAQRDLDTLLLVKPSKRCTAVLRVLEGPYLERWRWMLIGKEAEARDDSRPSPLRRTEIKDVDTQDVTWFSTLNVYRPVDLV
jgi:hypothetical protein